MASALGQGVLVRLTSDLHAVLPLDLQCTALLNAFHSGGFMGVLRPPTWGQGVLVRLTSDLHAVLTS